MVCKDYSRCSLKRTFVLFVLVLSVFAVSTVAESIVDVTVSEAKAMIDADSSLVILDVRTQSEYDGGHIRNARLIPHTELQARLGELDINDEILVYCQTGGRSSTASQTLVDNGFLHVYNMLGGIVGWIDEGHTVYVKYSSIQEAVDNAVGGETVFVSSGIYYESIVVNKTVSLVGEDSETTIIDTSRFNATFSPGIWLFGEDVKDVRVSDFTFKGSGSGWGIYIFDRANAWVENNIVAENSGGIVATFSDNNTISGNNVENNDSGILLDQSSNNTIFGNNIADNSARGVTLWNSSYNRIFHNNFVNNSIPGYQALASGIGNTWDNGYPSGGNFWSDYTGEDLDGDGIGDTPHQIYSAPVIAQDRYPLMGSLNRLDAGTWNQASYTADVVSNSTVSDFYFNPAEGAFVRLNVTGEEGAVGFCRVTIPKQLLWVEDGQWLVLVDDMAADPRVAEDENCTYLYFVYDHSTKTVEIRGTNVVPEFPSPAILPILIIATLLVWVSARFACNTPQRISRVHTKGRLARAPRLNMPSRAPICSTFLKI